MLRTAYGFISESELVDPFCPASPIDSLPSHEFANCPTELSPKLAYFAGYFFGDGGLKNVERSYLVSRRREYKMIIADEFESQMMFIQSLYSDLFGDCPPIRYERLSKGERTLYINPTSKRVYLFLTVLFELPCGSKTNSLHAPAVVWNAPVELQRWFLRGLFDAEGDTRAVEGGFKSAPRVKIRMKCIPFIREVKSLFESAFGLKINGPYLDPNNVSAYIQVERFSDIVFLAENHLFLHPVKQWRLAKTAEKLSLRTQRF